MESWDPCLFVLLCGLIAVTNVDITHCSSVCFAFSLHRQQLGKRHLLQHQCSASVLGVFNCWNVCCRSSSSCCLPTRAWWWSSWWARAGSRRRPWMRATKQRCSTRRSAASALSSRPWHHKSRICCCPRRRRQAWRNEHFKLHRHQRWSWSMLNLFMGQRGQVDI